MKNNIPQPNQLRAFVAIAWFSLLAQTRNKATFFFGFLFPIVFITIFGLIGNSNVKVAVGIPTTSNQQNPVILALKNISIISMSSDTKQTLDQKLKQGKLDAEIAVQKINSVQPTYNITVLLSSTNIQNREIISGIIQEIVDKTNLQLAGVKNPPIKLSFQSISGRKSRYIDFALPGMIGFSLLSTAIFGTVFGLIFLKKTFVIKRMFATPMYPLTFLLGQGLSRLIIAIIQTIMILLVGIFIFKFYLPHGLTTFIELLILSVIGLIAFLGFGYFMAGLANDENSANPMINLVTLPQFLLAGTFFPTDSLPAWLQPIANNLPLSYFNAAIRKITTDGDPFRTTFPYLLGLIIWGGVMYILATKTFKWE